MMHRRAIGFGLFGSVTLLALSGPLSGCSGQRSKASVVLENQSSAALQVEVAVPSRGALGRKPSHEGFLKRLEPGEKWASDADTHHYSMEPNPEQAFRVVVTDFTSDPHVVYAPVLVKTGNLKASIIFRGTPGAVSMQGFTSGGSAVGGEEKLPMAMPRQ